MNRTLTRSSHVRAIRAVEKGARPTQQIEGAPGRGTLEKESAILGMIQRGGQVV